MREKLIVSAIVILVVTHAVTTNPAKRYTTVTCPKQCIADVEVRDGMVSANARLERFDESQYYNLVVEVRYRDAVVHPEGRDTLTFAYVRQDGERRNPAIVDLVRFIDRKGKTVRVIKVPHPPAPHNPSL